MLQRSKTLGGGRMRCRQPCRPADWAGLGKASLVLFRARNTLEELGGQRWPGGAGAGKGGR